MNDALNRIEMDVGFANLVVEKFESDIYQEFAIYLEDKETVTAIQNIAVVQKTYDEDSVDCLVWADKYNEDYTERFRIGKYEEVSD